MMSDRKQRTPPLGRDEYETLAAFRYALRRFLTFSEAAAADVGLASQQYQALLAIKGSGRDSMTIRELARQLLIKHNSAVGLVDRLARNELIVRETSAVDRRRVELHLSPRGRRVLARLAAMQRRELQRIGPIMKRFFAELAAGRSGAVD